MLGSKLLVLCGEGKGQGGRLGGGRGGGTDGRTMTPMIRKIVLENYHILALLFEFVFFIYLSHDT